MSPAAGWQTAWRHALLPGERALSVAAVRLKDQASGATVPLLAVGAALPAGGWERLNGGEECRLGLLRSTHALLPACTCMPITSTPTALTRRRGLPLRRPPAAV